MPRRFKLVGEEGDENEQIASDRLDSCLKKDYF